MAQIESQEKESTISKLRELVDSEKKQGEDLMKEIEKMANRLAEAQDALYEA